MWTVFPPYHELESTLKDPTSPIGKRMRAAYYAKQMYINLLRKKNDEQHSNDDNGDDDDDDGDEKDGNDKNKKNNHHDDDDVVDGDMIVNLLCEQVFVRDHGSLLRHEFAYVLGQMQTTDACNTLEELLLVDDDCVMVRHEAAEALGAIGSSSSRRALQVTLDKYKGVLDELSDTCLLALNRIDYIVTTTKGEEGPSSSSSSSSTSNKNTYHDSSIPVGCACMLPAFNSIDPAMPDPKHVALTTVELGDILLGLRGIQNDADNGGGGAGGGCTDKNNDDGIDQDKTRTEVTVIITSEQQRQQQRQSTSSTATIVPLMERYRAMFSLRNRGGVDAILQLCRALTDDDSSPLLRHEVAFVLGQLQHPCSIPALEESLSRQYEHTMVRHESAEALGAIDGTADDWTRIEKILMKYQEDPNQAVAESCVVALDAADYWGHCSKSNDNNDDNDDDDDYDDYDVGDEVLDTHSAPQDTTSSSSFGKQKHQLLEPQPSGDDIRRYILSEHFNVQRS